METDIYLLLEQADIWIDRQGRRHDVAEMTTRYKRNVIQFLERHAKNLALAHSVGQINAIFAPIGREVTGVDENGQDVLGGLVHGGPRGEAAQDALDAAINAEDVLKDADPVAWIRSTPLVSRMLDDIAAGRGGEDD